ncbi:hypothetical protein EDD36DRAFT_471713 [Exophiala viscosa]|uniref:Uncharacterized protein n=1 Tax=Exophiala viscosa TaxID=2486360 RepID=A0AAN6E1N6_9EURO|nr:hypothetical protein EDD36DRAFT_471713 [Exophiala viscosa]
MTVSIRRHRSTPRHKLKRAGAQEVKDEDNVLSRLRVVQRLDPADGIMPKDRLSIDTGIPTIVKNSSQGPIVAMQITQTIMLSSGTETPVVIRHISNISDNIKWVDTYDRSHAEKTIVDGIPIAVRLALDGGGRSHWSPTSRSGGREPCLVHVQAVGGPAGQVWLLLYLCKALQADNPSSLDKSYRLRFKATGDPRTGVIELDLGRLRGRQEALFGMDIRGIPPSATGRFSLDLEQSRNGIAPSQGAVQQANMTKSTKDCLFAQSDMFPGYMPGIPSQVRNAKDSKSGVRRRYKNKRTDGTVSLLLTTPALACDFTEDLSLLKGRRGSLDYIPIRRSYIVYDIHLS